MPDHRVSVHGRGRLKTYCFVKYDEKPPQAILAASYTPVGEIWQVFGFLFVPRELAAKLGEPDDAVLIGTYAFPAWSVQSDSFRRVAVELGQ